MAPQRAVKRGAGDPDALWLLATPEGGERARGSGRSKRDDINRERIVATAIAVADDEGAAAVTMRRVARELDVTPMALYWHVGDKDGLLALMVDVVEGEIEVAEPSGDWRADLTATARAYRAALIRHGWMTDFIGHRRSLGPNELPHIERSLAALDGLGLTVHECFNILMAVETYYLGFAIREQQELAVERQNAGITARQRRAFVQHEGERLRATGSYPQLATLFESGEFVDRDVRFTFGLDRLLDGIQAGISSAMT